MIVKVVKLISGEDVLCECTPCGPNNERVVIENPLLLVMGHKQDGTLGINILPFAPYVQGNITIEMDKVVYIATPKDDLVNQYKQATGVGLITPPSGILR
jgi:hypothetical protein